MPAVGSVASTGTHPCREADPSEAADIVLQEATRVEAAGIVLQEATRVGAADTVLLEATLVAGVDTALPEATLAEAVDIAGGATLGAAATRVACHEAEAMAAAVVEVEAFLEAVGAEADANGSP
jgi:hypothetical protein